MILLTGGTGQLGTELKKLREYLAPTRLELNITNEENVARYLNQNIDLIVHSAAYTDTLSPERNHDDAAECYKINVLGTRNIIKYAKCPVVFISTESVLEPYNFYCLTKLAAEREVKKHSHYKIIRTSFREDPFEYDKACVDMFTIGDTVKVIAGLIDKSLDIPCNNTIEYIGTGVKTVYDLAKKTKPDVEPCTRGIISTNLPAMESLLCIP